MRGTDDETRFGWSKSRVYAIYAVWLAILVVSLMAGGYTLGFLVDTESIGTAENPNSLQVVETWANFAVSNTEETTSGGGGGGGSTSDGSYANDDDGSYANDDDGSYANTQSRVTTSGVLACEANAFCSVQPVMQSPR